LERSWQGGKEKPFLAQICTQGDVDVRKGRDDDILDRDSFEEGLI